MRRVALVGLVLVLLAGPAAQGAAPSPPEQVAIDPLPIGTVVKPFALVRLLPTPTFGQVIGRAKAGLACWIPSDMQWGDRMEGRIKAANLPDVFRKAMGRAGFKVDGDPSNLFEAPGSASDLAVGGLIDVVDADVCMPNAAHRDYETLHGAFSMNVEWQVYSRLQQQVVATIKTTARPTLKDDTLQGWRSLFSQGMRLNTGALAASPEFRKLVINEIASAPTASGPQAPIRLSGPAAKAAQPINEAAGSVVAVFAGDGFGSGFLVSDEGYLLTNWHVVQTAKQVRVRWSDGFEGLGDVVRSDKRRDVALVKVGPHGRSPLALRLSNVQPGETVFAIGTPLDPKFQSTVTRGVVSASRLYDGFSFIQSDVAINHGNSGGPLLDEKGAVVGIAVSGYEIGGAPVGVNLFIPIGDALDFLNLTTAP